MIDSEGFVVPGSREVAEVLRTDPLYAALGSRLAHPVVLGFVLFAFVVATIVLGPASDVRFIYTDF